MEQKKYRTLSNFFKEKFGQKVYKISIDAGFSCPNRDGKISYGGCIFCSEKGSGEFAGSRKDSITVQFNKVKERLSKKWPQGKYITHLQAFTNTYASPKRLKAIYEEAISNNDVVGLAIATRPDCIEADVLEVLNEFNRRSYLFVELGFQTAKEETAKIINRGYDNSCFSNCVKRLREKNIDVIIHVIIGLPGENRNDAVNTIKYLSKMDIQGIKLHLMYIVKGTKLEEMYYNNEIKPLEMDEYVSTVVDCLEELPKEIVIHRLTGDGDKETLIAPLWSRDKMRVLSAIDQEFSKRGSYQGKNYREVKNE